VDIGVLFGGPSPEHDISILTGLQAVRELERAGRSPRALYWTKTGDFVSVPTAAEPEAFLEGVPAGSSELALRLGPGGGIVQTAGRLGRERRLDLDVVVLATHGGPGEDGSLQGALDLAGIAYSGPSAAGAALGMDKWSFAAVVAAAGLPTLERHLLTAEGADPPFVGPYILKPRFGGSSIGIDVVADVATARARLATNVHLSRGCVVEPYRGDLSDLQIAVLTYPEVRLSAIERPLRRAGGAEILDYRDKYVGREGMAAAPRELPATLPAGQREAIEAAARTLVEAASLRGVARIDFLASESELYVNEVNTIPGSLSKHLFVEPAMAFLELLDALCAEALARPAHRYSTAGADGAILRSSGPIAAKLA
jgi:D-alanine-D-alanine ligase